MRKSELVSVGWLLGLACSTAFAGPVLGYNWPLHPATQQHPIRGTLGEYRETKGVSRLHNGVDIGGYPGEPVYAIDAGWVGQGGAKTETYVKVGNKYYIHLTHREPEGKFVAAGAKIGEIHPKENHVHLREGDGIIVNPLRASGLSPFSDNASPIVEDIEAVYADLPFAGEPFGRDENNRQMVYGRVDVKARAYDPRIDANGNSDGKGIGVYRVGYEIRNSDGELIVWWPDQYHFDTLTKHKAAWIYAPGSTYKPVNFMYWATNTGFEDGAWDTRPLEPGVYKVRVTAEDIMGHQGQLVEEVDVVNCVFGPGVNWGMRRDSIDWEDVCDPPIAIYRSDHRWGPYREIASFLWYDTTVFHCEYGHCTYVDNTVEYSRPYWYRFLDTYIGSAVPDSLPQPTLPDRPTGFIAAHDSSGCGNTVLLSWGESAGADSYYVFRCGSETMDDCVPVPELLGATASLTYTDAKAYPNHIYCYSVVAWNETGSSQESVADTVMFESGSVSLTASQVSVSDDSITVCPGGDADSLAIDVTLVDVCGQRIEDESPSEIYAVLVASEGDVHVCGGDTLWSDDFTDEAGHTEIVVHHIGGYGRDTVRVYARGLPIAQQPVVAFRSPDLDADGTVNSSDWALWVVGGKCTDLNWDGTEKDSIDLAIFNAHWPHTASPAIAINAPSGSEWWNAGDEAEITWQFAPTQMTNAYDTVDLFLSTDGGVSYPELIASVLPNNGSYLWTIPQGLSFGECKVKAVGQDAHGCFVSDTSNAAFTIAAVKSGFVVADTTWDSPVSVVGDVVVAEGARLGLVSGAIVRFDTLDALHSGQDSTTCELIVMGGLRAQGSQAKPVELSSISSSPQAGDWRGIRFRPTSSSDSLEHCVIKYAYNGIEACTTSVTVDSCVVSDFSNDGIKASGSTVTITGSSISLGSTGVRGIELLNASGSAGHNVITGSSQGTRYGIQCSGAGSVSLSHNELEDVYVGIKASGTSQLDISDNLLTGNASQGVVAEGSCEMTLRRNRISDYGYYGVALKNSAYVDLGAEPDSGMNSIPKRPPVSSYCVLNKRTVTVMAEANWWGTDMPLPSYFYGPVDRIPYLTEDPQLEFALRAPEQVLVVPRAAYAVQNYPNPMNPVTTIEYGVPEDGMRVAVRVFDVSGHLVRVLVQGRKLKGIHTVSWDGCSEDGRRVASGVYLYEAVIGEYRVSKKIVILK